MKGLQIKKSSAYKMKLNFLKLVINDALIGEQSGMFVTEARISRCEVADLRKWHSRSVNFRTSQQYLCITQHMIKNCCVL